MENEYKALWRYQQANLANLTYGKISWGFLFIALEKMGMVVEFINMVKVLFQDVKAKVCINWGIINSFKMERGLRQGCPLPPYLFILVQEVFYFMMKEVTKRKVSRGSLFPRGVQVNIHYVNMWMTIQFIWKERNGIYEM